jgi:hypothetical protein
VFLLLRCLLLPFRVISHHHLRREEAGHVGRSLQHHCVRRRGRRHVAAVVALLGARVPHARIAASKAAPATTSATQSPPFGCAELPTASEHRPN